MYDETGQACQIQRGDVVTFYTKTKRIMVTRNGKQLFFDKDKNDSPFFQLIDLDMNIKSLEKIMSLFARFLDLSFGLSEIRTCGQSKKIEFSFL